jgi:RimJ/RimL family protein N-acetyltransferase
LTARVDPDNAASIRVLEKGGFRLGETHPGDGNFPNLEPGLSRDRLVYVCML